MPEYLIDIPINTAKEFFEINFHSNIKSLLEPKAMKTPTVTVNKNKEELMSKEQLIEHVKELENSVVSLQKSLEEWKKVARDYQNTCAMLEVENMGLRKTLKQEDIRRVINRALKAHGYKPLGIARNVAKDVFLSSISNHLHSVLSKDIPRDELVS